MRRSCGSLAEIVASEYFFASSALGANMRAAVNSRPVLDSKRLRIPPVRDLWSEYGVMIAYASCSAIRLGSRRWFCRFRGGRGGGGCRRFAAQHLYHYRSTRRTLAFYGLASVFRNDFHRITDLFFSFALDAISFGHRKIRWRALHAPAV